MYKDLIKVLYPDVEYENLVPVLGKIPDAIKCMILILYKESGSDIKFEEYAGYIFLLGLKRMMDEKRYEV